MSISQLQNSDENLALLAAQRHLYASSKSPYAVRLFVVTGVSVAIAISATLWPQIKAYTVLWTVIAIVLDFRLSGLTDQRKRVAANIQEEFDCNVLGMQRSLAATAHPDPEDVASNAAAYFEVQDRSRLENWYPPEVDQVPLYIGRLICQRSNLR